MDNECNKIIQIIEDMKCTLDYIIKNYFIEDEKFLLALDKVLFDKQICLLNKKCKLDYIRSVFYSTPKSIALTYLILCYLSKIIYSHMGELVDFTWFNKIDWINKEFNIHDIANHTLEN